MNSSLIQVLFMFMLFLHIQSSVPGVRCPPYSEYDSTEAKCVCQEGYHWVDAAQTCDPDVITCCNQDISGKEFSNPNDLDLPIPCLGKKKKERREIPEGQSKG
ncbi:Hypothetical predicted protein [Mytilus galloprovincialis]|uniref:Uncharacterized protein n=1 Tax=Mytilus galloprovincialis TaxID=29158 RepID=A0A8B6EZW0_MYTGA|nr:Hypothetical predicted protein [Mytilus galloprovincialis]